MTALNTLCFSGYTLRPAGEADRKLAEQWTAWDEEHAGKIDPGFWLEQRPGMDSVLLLDALGPVLFCKVALYAQVVRNAVVDRERPLPGHLAGLSAETIAELKARREGRAAPATQTTAGPVAEVFVQFMPCATEEDRERTREALARGMEWLEPVLEMSGAEEIFFDSRQEKLIAFCIKRLGFKAEGGTGMRRLRKALVSRQRG